PVRGWVRPLLPPPGKGPGERALEAGLFRYRIRGEGPDAAGRMVRGAVLVGALSDPGYAETAKMLAETALSLAADEAVLPRRAGVLTPATAVGLRLVERLRGAGMVFQTQPARG
ncbi:MAG TPA: hypothetical protein VNT60_09505, partial [Deinococcales bacterium]|nr:hypothetical protein [Deinococcales bacterium]